jgi:uncharacterized protein YkwD
MLRRVYFISIQRIIMQRLLLLFCFFLSSLFASPKVVLIPLGETLIPVVIEEERLVEGEVELDEELLLSLVNEARSSGRFCGSRYYAPTSLVSWSNTIEQATRLHSDDMYRNNFFSHTGSDGSSAGDRLSRVGYDWATYGENIAWGYRSEASVIAGWLSSDGHCANIMNGGVREMGLTRVGDYWTQLFGAEF